MDVLTTPAEMRAWADARIADGARIGFVPTMGALHRGHMELVEQVRAKSDVAVVSIFVNPLQFNVSTDYDGYPRPIDRDLEACQDAAVDAVYAPTPAAMYPPGSQTRVVPGELAAVMEGPMRPGHFDGVVTVVTKLFNAVKPHVAAFGQKDFQQLRIVTQLATDLDTGVEIIPAPIVREDDGVAMSSRNERLTDAQRDRAVCVPRSLEAAVQRAASPGATVGDVRRAAIAVVNDEPMARHEYTTIFDAESLSELHDDEPLSDRRAGPAPTRVATAVWFGDVRLIDNRPLFD